MTHYLDSIPTVLNWIQYLSFFKYAYEALIVNELSSATIYDDLAGVKVAFPASVVLTKFGFNLTAFWRNIFISIGLVVALIGILICLVVFKLKERR